MITSRNNALIKTVRSLNEKKVRAERGEYLAEGVKTVAEAINSSHRVKLIIATEKGLSLLESAADITGIPTETVSDGVFDAISGDVTPQGVMAVVEKPAASMLAPRGNCIFLDGVSDPSNVGAVIRTAAAAGYDEVYLADCADAYSPKSVRASMGGIFRVEIKEGGRENLAEQINLPFYVADMDGENAFEVHPRGGFCIVIGSESHGVSEFMKTRAEKMVAVPMLNGMESLNAAVAAGILMYALKNNAVR